MKLPGIFKNVWITILAFKSVLFCCLYAVVLSIIPATIPGKVAKASYVLLLMTGLWVTEAIPIYITALIPLVFGPLLGIAPASVISPSYTKDTNILFFGGLMVACAIENNYIHKRIAISILKLVGSDPKMLMLGFMLPSWFLSMWMSNTATAAMMITIVDALLTDFLKMEEEEDNAEYNYNNEFIQDTPKSLNRSLCHCRQLIIQIDDNQQELPPITAEKNLKRTKRMNIGFSLSIAYACSIGGIATTIGTPANSILQGQVYNRYGPSTGLYFGTWMGYAFPLSVFMLLFTWFWLSFLFIGPKQCFTFKQSEKRKKLLARLLTEEQQKLGPIKYCEVLSAFFFVILTLLWMTRNLGSTGWGKWFIDPSNPKSATYITDSAAAILMTIIVMITPAANPITLWKHWKHCYETKSEPNPEITRTLLPWNVAVQKFPWGVILVVGGGFALATIMESSGLTTAVGGYLGERLKYIPVTLLNIVCTFTTAAMTEFASNSATASIILPIVYGLCEELGIHPFLIAFPTTVATSFSFALPAATPPNTIVFAKGRVRVKHMIMAGIPMNIVGCFAAIGAVSSYTVPLFGLNTVPSWVNDVKNKTTIK
ncbi:unnamed protein product [Trichobilharzia szidati]|nr:unnamed protein product [Trichobilharzia szidati]